MKKLISLLAFLLLTTCDPVIEGKLGKWIEPEEQLEIVGVHAALMDNGNVLTFCYLSIFNDDRQWIFIPVCLIAIFIDSSIISFTLFQKIQV